MSELGIESAIASPFVGLRPYRSTESLLFFGRRQQVIELLERLHRARFVPVVGSSGSGKSSLIRAGLIPLSWRQVFWWKIVTAGSWRS